MERLAQTLIQHSKAMGFIAIGLSSPARPLFLDHFKSWLSAHNNADMSWLEKNLHLREDPSLLLEGCRAVISLAYPYPSRKPTTADGLAVSRYSRPDHDDYHKSLRRLCMEIIKVLKDYDSGCQARICIDSAPLPERSIAYASGIGFIGKNNMLIIPGYGSYFYLAEILTTIPLEIQPVKTMDNQCGSCTMCLDACPMGALEKPFSLNASRCLSYLTIEHKGQLGPAEGGRMGDCFFGCDRCQEACPFNAQKASLEVLLPSSKEILEMNEQEFMRRFGKTSFKRTGLEKIKGNIRAIKA